MADYIYETNYDVRSFLVNARKHLGLTAVLNVMQDVAWRHGERQGFGWDDTIRRGTFWVMTRQSVRLGEPAVLGDRISVRTWLRPPDRGVVLRDFTLHVRDREVARGTTSFMLLDLKTRRPRREALDFGAIAFATDHLDLEPARILPSPEALARDVVRVRPSDLDVNAHVNNVAYARWVLDVRADGDPARPEPTDYDVCFLAEARGGDEVELATADDGTHVRGTRLTDGTLIFTARVVRKDGE